MNAMTLQEMSREYEASAKRISAKLRVLRARLRQSTDPAECWQLRQRIAVLAEVLTQTKELSRLMAHYYERGYWRNEKYTL